MKKTDGNDQPREPEPSVPSSGMVLESTVLGESKIPDEIPILPNEDYVLYPAMIAPLVVEGEQDLKMVDEAVRGDRMIGLFAVRPPEKKEDEDKEEKEQGQDEEKRTAFDRIYEVGTAATILKMLKIPDGSIRLLVHGVGRIRIKERLATEPYPRAAVESLERDSKDDTETRAMKKNTLKLLKSFVENGSLPEDLLVAATNLNDPGKLSDLVAANLSVSVAEQQGILEVPQPKDRLLKIQELLTRELEILSIGNQIQSEINSRMDKHKRDYILREQIKAMRKELGEGAEGGSETEELRSQIEKAKLPSRVRSVAEKELSRLESMAMGSPEYTVSRTYLDWIVALPWSKQTRGKIDLKKARKILDEDHYDLEKIKERILEYLAVIKLRKTLKGPILCLVGPPGTGKTSLGRSIARAMGRRFARISLGGMRDEAEIRGHRRTYIGSLPGRIIKAMKDCGTINPVIMLDEIEKLGADFRGDPASALLEVLDPEQNFSFTDHYLDLPYDLSKVMFITTANIVDTIPAALLDRMEVLHLSGYTLSEKLHIARRYLIPRALENSGLTSKAISFTGDGIESIIENYTREAGLRNLEREINNVCRKVARRVAEGKTAKVKADAIHIEKALGPRRYSREDAGRADVPGVAVALAWTPAGGDVLFIEATSTPGDGSLTLTGQLGDVMKESAQAALTYLRANCGVLGMDCKFFEKMNFHIHVPAGAIPKDGPSAGVAMMMALASLVLGKPIASGVAMTGEITLKGTVLPVGGVKEKTLAAHRIGIRDLILPRDNERDLAEIPDEIRKVLTFHFVDRAENVLKIGFATHKKARKARAKSARKKKVKRPAAGKRRRHESARGEER